MTELTLPSQKHEMILYVHEQEVKNRNRSPLHTLLGCFISAIVTYRTRKSQNPVQDIYPVQFLFPLIHAGKPMPRVLVKYDSHFLKYS